MSPDGVDPQETVYGDTYRPRKRKQPSHNQAVVQSDVYARLKCLNCKAIWDISFENTQYPPGEYAMAIEQVLDNPCQACGSGKLKLSQQDTPKTVGQKKSGKIAKGKESV